MPTANPFIADHFADFLLGGLLLVIVLLVIVALLLWRGRTTSFMMYLHPLANELDGKIARLVQAAEHSANVSAVVSMLSQINGLDEASMARLESYPKDLRTAAWLHHINLLGADLQAAQQMLSDAHQRKGGFSQSRYYGDIAAARKSCQQDVDNLRAKLDKAIELSGQVGGLRVV